MNNETTFLSDLTIRKALSYSVDRKSIVKLIGEKKQLGFIQVLYLMEMFLMAIALI